VNAFDATDDRDPVAHAAPRPLTRARDGVTLIELMIAVIMLVVAVGGLLGSSAAVAKQMGGGVSQTVAAGLAQARLDSLTSLSCAQLDAGGAGTATTRGVKETWSVVDGKNIKTIVVTVKVPRRTNSLQYQMVIPCRD
jgi:Tfp pilus assembly protein PilV